MSDINFSRQLIKGRIAEMVFEQMLRDAKCFTVLRFGYENILPELMHRQHDIKVEQTMEVIRSAPDFAVINNGTHDVHLIEVKYRHNMTAVDNLKIAERMYESWRPSYLFVATPSGFFFGKVADIIKDKGVIAPLRHKDISETLQHKYIELMKSFIRADENSPDDR